MKILRTASLGSNFTGSYKKECSWVQQPLTKYSLSTEPPKHRPVGALYHKIVLARNESILVKKHHTKYRKRFITPSYELKHCDRIGRFPVQTPLGHNRVLTRKLQLGPSGPNWESKHQHTQMELGGLGGALRPCPPPSGGLRGGAEPPRKNFKALNCIQIGLN